MSHVYDVIVIGDYFTDLVFSGLDRLPTLGSEIFSSGFEMIPGGAYNSALALHRLGVRVGWVCDFGTDEFSRFALGRATAEGLDDALFVCHPQPLRRITVSVSYPHDRAFITFCDADPPDPAVTRVCASARARVVLLAGVFAGPSFECVVGACRAQQMLLVMDGNSSDEVRLEVAAVREAIRRVDVFMPNASEARRITGQADLEGAMRTLAGLGPLVVVKDGPHGAHACAGGEIVHAPAIPVEPVDTTGAGDCFNAGLLTAWLDGLPLPACLRHGNIVGGLSTLSAGGTGRAVTRQDVQAWLHADAR
jgi:sugar/nucleoside kinase (ribokinase family)